jgi:N-acetylmuramoyl-L-alanine amidase
MKKIVALLIVFGFLLSTFPILSPKVEASVYNYDITTVTRTGSTEVTVKLQVQFCGACNPNYLSSPGCFAFTHGYPPPYYPYSHSCGGLINGRYVAVRLKDEAGNSLGMQKLVCNQANWPINQLVTRDFVFPNIPLTGLGTVIAEADVYCSWCGHWYPQPKSLQVEGVRVCIDAGHGGTDLGVLGWTEDTPNTAAYPSEKYMNLEIALNLKASLEKKGYQVVMTRTTDVNVGDQERCDTANNNGCDIFVSIHANAFSDASADGSVTYYPLDSVNGLDLAKHIQSKLVESIGLDDRGTQSAEFYLLEHTNMPAALVEVGFLTNKSDYEFLSERPELPSTINVLMSDGEVVPMNLEQYLRGVVAAEMYSYWDIEALKAQAVAARTYAASANNHPELGAHVCTTTHCQAWTENYNDAADRAVNATLNQVIMYRRNVVPYPVYFSHCIGETRNSEDVWGYYHEYLRSVSCGGILCNTPSEDPAHDGCRGDHTALGYFGHGVGMCQHGAQAMAVDGKTYVDVLWHYYTDIYAGAFTNLEKAVKGISNGIDKYFEERGLTITAKCPVDLVVTDPDGLRICKDFTEIPGASYAEIEINGDTGVQIRIPDRKIGDYLIEVVPRPGALPTDTFTLTVSLFGVPVVIARNMPISEIPSEPYVVVSTETRIIPPIVTSTIDFDPDVLNLRTRKGVVTVYIELPEDYDVAEIDLSSVILNGTVAAKEWPAAIGDYDKDGIPDLMVKFDRAAVQAAVQVGESVAITVTGQVAGIGFEGSDIIRVINP